LFVELVTYQGINMPFVAIVRGRYQCGLLQPRRSHSRV